MFFLLPALAIAGQQASPQGRESFSTWKRISKCGLTFSLPSTLKEREVLQIDSCLGAFESEDLSVSFDYGLYSGVSNYEYYENLKEEMILIDKRRGQFASYRDRTMDPACNSVARLFVVTDPPRDGWGETALNMFVVGRSSETVAIARKIFASIRIAK